MPNHDSQNPSAPPSKAGPAFTESARSAAQAAKAAKRANAEPFGTPELFIVKAGEQSFTWELRRFGGLVLQRGPSAFDSAASARADGEAALAALRASPDLPTFKRMRDSGAGPGGGSSIWRRAPIWGYEPAPGFCSAWFGIDASDGASGCFQTGCPRASA